MRNVSANRSNSVASPVTTASTSWSIAAGPGIRRLISGELTPAAAIDQEVLAVVAGDATLLERFAETFRIEPGVVLAA